MQDQSSRQPMVNAPAVVVGLLILLVAIHAARQVASIGVDEQVLTYLALYPFRLGPTGDTVVGGYWVGVSSLATHALLHADWVHLLINGAWLLAFGTLVARRTAVLGFLALFVVCAVAGGLVYVGINGFSRAIVIGASGAVSGLMGAAFRLIFSAIDDGGIAALQRYPRLVPRMPLLMALSDRRTMVATGVWVLVNLFFGLFGAQFFGAGGIAWEAHLGGFLAGFLLFGFVDRGRRWGSPMQDRPTARDPQDW